MDFSKKSDHLSLLRKVSDVLFAVLSINSRANSSEFDFTKWMIGVDALKTVHKRDLVPGYPLI
jgi:hypothetical protein